MDAVCLCGCRDCASYNGMQIDSINSEQFACVCSMHDRSFSEYEDSSEDQTKDEDPEIISETPSS